MPTTSSQPNLLGEGINELLEHLSSDGEARLRLRMNYTTRWTTRDHPLGSETIPIDRVFAGDRTESTGLVLTRYPRIERKPMELTFCRLGVETLLLPIATVETIIESSGTAIIEGRSSTLEDGSSSLCPWASIQGIPSTQSPNYKNNVVINTLHKDNGDKEAYTAATEPGPIGPRIVVRTADQQVVGYIFREHRPSDNRSDERTTVRIDVESGIRGIDPCLMVSIAADAMNRRYIVNRQAHEADILGEICDCCLVC